MDEVERKDLLGCGRYFGLIPWEGQARFKIIRVSLSHQSYGGEGSLT